MKLTLVILVILSSLFFNTSCLKRQNLNDDNLGAPIAPAELSTAIKEEFGDKLFIDDIKKDEFSSYILTEKIQDTYSQTIEQQDMTVKAVESTPDHFKFDTQVTKITYQNGQSTQQTREWSWLWQYDPNPTATRPLAPLAENERPTYLFERLIAVMNYYCKNEGEFPQSCHNMSSVEIDYFVPPATAPQHNCTNAYQCFIKARKIEFDQVLLNEFDIHGKPKRQHIKLVISNDVPFLSRMLQYCQRGLFDMSSQQILVDYCYTINSYAFGRN
ncbi:MAG: hypothetical protein H7061_12715 [Bdellovibrionaceae bacterium]|nr:hypothetical protein [Bdellovibrio sp.]